MAQEGRSRKPLQRAMMATVPGITRIAVNEWAEIRLVDPDTTYNYNATGAMQAGRKEINGVVNTHHKIVLKFSSQIPATITAPCYMATGYVNNHPAFDFLKNGPQGNVDALFKVGTIKSDFDCSAVTWNNVPAVGTSVNVARLAVSSWTAQAVVTATFFTSGIMTPLQDPDTVAGLWSDIQGAYGVLIYVDAVAAPVDSWNAFILAIISGTKAYLEYGS